MHVKIFLLMILCSVCNCRVFGEDASAGALAFVRLNNASLDSFDVLVEVKSFEDKSQGSTERKLWFRIAYDSSNRHGAMLKRGEVTLIDSSKGIVPERNQRLSSGVIVDTNAGALRNFPQRTSILTDPNLDAIAQKMRIPNPHLFGLLPFQECSLWGDNSLDHVMRLQSIAEKSRSLPSGFQMQAVILDKTPRLLRLLKWDIENETSLPSELRVVSHLLEEKRDVPTNVEMLTWGEAEDTFVPVEI